MFRTVAAHVLAFDAEWVPDAALGRELYGLPPTSGERESWEEMWRYGGATEDDPRPYLKTVVCRVVSIAGVLRSANGGDVRLSLVTLPDAPSPLAPPPEAAIIQPFLAAVGRRCPQLVGYNSHAADLKILLQRGVALGLQAPDFCRRPGKPWEGPDYFARHSEWNLDLKEILGGWGRATPSLHELAVASGIPGKLEVAGDDVAELWLAGEYARIVDYNELDAFTTYLLWLRLAHFGGHFTTYEYRDEQARFRALLEEERERRDAPHVTAFLDAWDRLRATLRR